MKYETSIGCEPLHPEAHHVETKDELPYRWREELSLLNNPSCHSDNIAPESPSDRLSTVASPTEDWPKYHNPPPTPRYHGRAGWNHFADSMLELPSLNNIDRTSSINETSSRYLPAMGEETPQISLLSNLMSGDYKLPENPSKLHSQDFLSVQKRL